MKILIIANDSGGLYKFRRELIEVLTLNKHTVAAITPITTFSNELHKCGCQVIPMEMNRHGMNPVDEMKTLIFYRRILKDIKPDIVFTYTIKPNVYGGMACAGLGIPYVANITGLGTAVENGGLMQKITLTLYRMGLRKAQKVFFQNGENRDFMVNRGVVRGAYDLLPGSGVNLSQYQCLPYPDRDTVNFVFVARVMKEKGIDQYLDAAKEIRKRHPETRFHICGFCEQDYQAELEELHRQGVVIYHGLVSDMSQMYKIAACTVHPTYYPEGLSNVLLESSASGRPIITTNRSGCREVVDDGVNGFVVREKDSADLIDKIERFLALPVEERKQMGLAGRAKVEREFDRQMVVRKYLDEVMATMKE